MKKIYLSLLVGLFLLPTILVAQNFTLAGTITRHNGDPVEGIEVTWDNTSVLTDFAGNYSLINIPINNPTGLITNGTFDKFDDVTVLDILVLRRHILGMINLNVPQLLEAEINGSMSVTTLDIVKLIKLVLHKDDGILPSYKYCFGDVSLNCMNTPSIAPAPDTIIILDAVAIKNADLAISSDYMPAPPNAPSPIISITEADFQSGDNVQIKVIVENFDGIKGIQQTFEWDNTLLEFESISGFNDLDPEINDTQVLIGKLPVLSVATSTNSMELEDGDILYTLNFKALADAPTNGAHLFLSDELTPPQIVWQNPDDNDLFVLEGEYVSVEEPTSIQDILSLKSFEVFPNPTRKLINVNILLQNPEPLEVKIINVLGQEIFTEKFNQEELNLKIDLEKYPNGMYFLSLQTEHGIRTESILKQ